LVTIPTGKDFVDWLDTFLKNLQATFHSLNELVKTIGHTILYVKVLAIDIVLLVLFARFIWLYLNNEFK
jgi:hypothetical protein